MLALDGPTSSERVTRHLVAPLDPDRSLDVAGALASGAFAPVGGRAPNLGYTQARVWMRLDMRNVTDDVEDWRFVFSDDMDMLRSFGAFLARDATVETLVDLDETSAFSVRPVPFGKLVAPVRLAPGDPATLLVRYTARGLSATSVRVETAASFAAHAAARATRNAVFYGATVVLVVIALIGLALTRRGVFLAYAAYAAAVLVHIVNVDGAGFRYLWPNAPRLNEYVAPVYGTALYVSAAFYARLFLRTATFHPRADRAFVAVIVLAVALLLVVPFADRQSVSIAKMVLGVVLLVLMVASGLAAARTRLREVRLFLLAWACAIAAIGVGLARHAVALDVPRDVAHDLQRFWLVHDALLMGLAVADVYNQQRVATREAVASGLAQARRNLELSERLNALEEAYGRASEEARHQGERMRDTVHDLRQPLAALRLNLRALVNDGAASDRDVADLETGFEYVEGLIAGQAGGSVAHAFEDGAERREAVDLGAILDAVEEMFAPDAAAKGVGLRFVPTRARTSVPPIVVMRCLSNLVSNAIKYTRAGRVLVGVRRHGERLRIEVHDTGPGLDVAPFDAALGRSVRLPGRAGAAGDGLGLAIVAQHARQHGFAIRRLRSRAGLSVALDVPAMEPADERPAPVPARLALELDL